MPDALSVFITELLQNTTHNVAVCSLPNTKSGGGKVDQLFSRNINEIVDTVRANDRAGYAQYFAVSTMEIRRRHDPRERNLENAREAWFIHADIDLKYLQEDISVEEIEKRIAPLKPSRVHRSGNGLHVYFRLDKPTTNLDAVRRLNEKLASVVGGDPTVTHPAALMRLPGTHNTKDDAWKEVTVTTHNKRTYTLAQLDKLFDRKSLLKRKTNPVLVTEDDSDPWAQYVKDQGYKTPLDIDQELKAMTHGNIHNTRVRVVASLVERDWDDGEICKKVVDAIAIVKKREKLDWPDHWREIEEREVYAMIDKWRAKKIRLDQQAKVGSGTVVSLHEHREAKKEKTERKEKKLTAKALPEFLANAFINEGLKQRGEMVLFTPKEECWWAGPDKIWKPLSREEETRRLGSRLQKICEQMGFTVETKVLSAAIRQIQFKEELKRTEDVEWDNNKNKIQLRNGLFDLKTRTLESYQFDHYVTMTLACDYDPDAKCPMMEQFIRDISNNEQDTIDLCWEWNGTALLNNKERVYRRTFVLKGDTHTGKSTYMDVIQGLFNNKFISAPLDSLDYAHGLVPFRTNMPWIVHEAFESRVWFPSGKIKALLSGDPEHANIKNGPQVSIAYKGPIIWGTNPAVQFQEETGAFSKRLLIINLTRVFDGVSGLHAKAVKAGYTSVAEMIVATELNGVLNKALEGLDRAFRNHGFTKSRNAEASMEAFLSDSNMVRPFLKECFTYNPKKLMKWSDFYGIFVGYMTTEHGKKLAGNRMFRKWFEALHDSHTAVIECRENSERFHYVQGLEPNEIGLTYFQALKFLQGRDIQAELLSPEGLLVWTINEPIIIKTGENKHEKHSLHKKVNVMATLNKVKILKSHPENTPKKR